MKNEITITRDEFRKAIAKEVEHVIEIGDGNGNGIGALMAGMLVTSFGASLSIKLFGEDEEENEDGADS